MNPNNMDLSRILIILIIVVVIYAISLLYAYLKDIIVELFEIMQSDRAFRQHIKNQDKKEIGEQKSKNIRG